MEVVAGKLGHLPLSATAAGSKIHTNSVNQFVRSHLRSNLLPYNLLKSSFSFLSMKVSRSRRK